MVAGEDDPVRVFQFLVCRTCVLLLRLPFRKGCRWQVKGGGSVCKARCGDYPTLIFA